MEQQELSDAVRLGFRVVPHFPGRPSPEKLVAELTALVQRRGMYKSGKLVQRWELYGPFPEDLASIRSVVEAVEAALGRKATCKLLCTNAGGEHKQHADGDPAG